MFSPPLFFSKRNLTMHLPTLLLDSFTDWELKIIKPFLTQKNEIIPRLELILPSPSTFVYQEVLHRLYRDTRFSVPVMYLNDRFQNRFYSLVENRDWRKFRTLLVYDPLDLLKLINKVIKAIDSSSAYPSRTK